MFFSDICVTSFSFLYYSTFRQKVVQFIIDYPTQELIKLRERSTSLSAIDYSKIRVMETGDNSDFTNIVQKMIELEQTILEETQQLLLMKRNVRESITKMEDVEERAVLQCKYVLGESWENVSQQLNISIATAYRLHRRALEKLIVFDSN